jgi:hypothetical protein
MSNHFTGLSLGPPLGDQRLDLCDLYAFQSPADKNRTVIILNANPNADALHPDAIYNASEPVNDRKRWLDQFVHLMGHTGNYTREEAIAAIDKEGTLPDVLSFDPSKPAKYPNGRVFTDDVINYRIAFLTKNQCPPTGLKPHTDVLKEFPYLGTPHSKK